MVGSAHPTGKHYWLLPFYLFIFPFLSLFSMNLNSYRRKMASLLY